MKIFEIFTLPLLGLALAVCASRASAEPSSWHQRKDAKMIRAALPSLPTSLDSTKLAFAEHFLIVQCLCETLVRVNEEGQITSSAAEKWEFSHEGREIRFTIASDKKFADGSRLSSADVIRALNLHFAPGSTSAISGYLNKIVVDPLHPFATDGDQAVVLRLKHSYPPLLHLLAMPGFCVQKIDGDKAVGSGAFRVSALTADLIRLEKNPFNASESKLNEIEFVAAKSTDEMLEKMKSGDIDLAVGLQVSDVEKMTNENFSLTRSESLATVNLYFNVEHNPHLNEEVRSELTALIQAAAEKNKNAFLEPSQTLLPPEILPLRYYQRPKPNDVKQAVARGSRGPLKIRLLASVFSQKLADEIAEAASFVGFKPDVKRVFGNDYLNAMKTGKYDLIGGRYFLNYPDPDAALEPFDKKSPFRLGRFDSKPVLDQLDQVRFIANNRERLEKYTDILIAFEKKSYVLPLYRLSLPIVHRPSLQIPSTSFRYEAELWKIFWKAK